MRHSTAPPIQRLPVTPMRSRAALMIASMAAAAGVSLLAGCPQRQCLRAHNETQHIPQYTQVCTGTSCSLQFSYFLPMTVAVCDEWADTPARASGAMTH